MLALVSSSVLSAPAVVVTVRLRRSMTRTVPFDSVEAQVIVGSPATVLFCNDIAPDPFDVTVIVARSLAAVPSFVTVKLPVLFKSVVSAP